MKRCILYYPHIYDISDNWLRQTILYWDEIGSIVPLNYEKEEPYSPDLAFLKSEGVFRPFRTDAIFSFERSSEFYEEIADFQKEFRDIILSDEFQKKVGKMSERSFKTDIYREKVNWGTFKFLEDEKIGLAKKKNSGWFSFEDNTGLLYMTLLAKYLAKVDKEASTSCGTDFKEYEDLSFKAKSNSQITEGIKLKFFDVLPVPKNNVSLQDILEFKEKRREELLNFRKVLIDTQKKIYNCENISEANDILAAFGEEKERELYQLNRLLGEAKISVVTGTIETISKAKASDWIAGFLTSGASLLATLGVSLGKYAIDKKNERSALLNKSTFAYLHSAERAGLLRNE